MKKIIAIVLLVAVLVLGSVAVFADPKAEPGIDTCTPASIVI